MNQEIGRFRIAFRQFLKPLAYSFLWTLLVTLIGLMQLWITIGLSYLFRPLDYSFSQILQDSVLLFFIMAIVATIAIDYFFSGLPRLPLGLEAIIFGVIPFVTGAFVSFTYVAMYMVDSQLIGHDIIDNEAASSMQKVAIIVAVLYSLFAKFVHFYNQIRSGK